MVLETRRTPTWTRTWTENCSVHHRTWSFADCFASLQTLVALRLVRLTSDPRRSVTASPHFRTSSLSDCSASLQTLSLMSTTTTWRRTLMVLTTSVTANVSVYLEIHCVCRWHHEPMNAALYAPPPRTTIIPTTITNIHTIIIIIIIIITADNHPIIRLYVLYTAAVCLLLADSHCV